MAIDSEKHGAAATTHRTGLVIKIPAWALRHRNLQRSRKNSKMPLNIEGPQSCLRHTDEYQPAAATGRPISSSSPR